MTWHKVYPVYYDGANDVTCGGASWPPALPGTVFAFYLRSVIPGLIPCFASGFAEAGEPPRYTEFAVLHDFMHDLGIVGPCSPHFWDAGHVNENPNDLMWSGTGSWTPSILDVGRDDYFQAHIPGCPDLDTSGFLTRTRTSPSPSPRSDPGQARSPAAPGTRRLREHVLCSIRTRDRRRADRPARGGVDLRGLGRALRRDRALLGHGRCGEDRYGPVQGSRTRRWSSRRSGVDRERSRACPRGCAVRPHARSTFPRQSRLELRASARAGSRFTGFGQDCSGRTCSFTLDRDKYVLATFADVQAPRVRALPSRGARGRLARLRYRVSENTGVARVTIRVGRRSIRTRFRRLAATRTYSARWRIPRSASLGAHRFCVRASDRSRHTSRRKLRRADGALREVFSAARARRSPHRDRRRLSCAVSGTRP